MVSSTPRLGSLLKTIEMVAVQLATMIPNLKVGVNETP
jgi:hypothetical protein